MRIYTVFTESHRPFFEKYFFKTFPFEPRIELRVLFKSQLGNAEFLGENWNKTMEYKVDCFIQAAQETPNGEYFMFSDPDIQFFKPFYDDIAFQMKNHDAVFQDDYFGGINTGFFAIRSLPNTRAFLNTVKSNLKRFDHEQHAFNSLIQHFKQLPKIEFKWKKLSKNYWTYGEKVIKPDPNLEKYTTWEGDENFDLPEDIVIHHANWTKTFKDKFRLLDLVRKKYNNKQKVFSLFDDASYEN